MCICIAGDTEDLSAVYLGWAARRAGHPVVALDERRLGVGWSFRFDDDAEGRGAILLEGRRLGFDELTGVFARFDPEAAIPDGLDLDGRDAAALRLERRAGLHQLLERLPCPVANRPSAGRSNGSKPLQMRALELSGFRVPRWLVSNDARRVRGFLADLGGPAIYKAVSGLRSRVRLADATLLDLLEAGTSPVLVQAYVPGTDVRVHVVDGECHGTEVLADGVDYRFDGARTYRARDVPDGVAALCRAVAGQEGLLLAGIDFRLDPDGAWHCLEVNPMPSFIPHQWATGQPIAEAVIEACARARRAAPGPARPT